MEREEGKPRFVADAMLGRLARWLRMLGYDTLYSSQLDDATLARLARAEERILITRDQELTRRRGVRSVLISDDKVEDQLREVMTSFRISPESPFTRCINCNAPLVESSPAEARGQVPPYVAATQIRFRRCPNCGRFYWRGTHWAKMRAALDDAGHRDDGD